MTDETTDDIRKQVQERVEQEAAQAGGPPGNGKPEITSKFINECLFANELGDGVFYATLFRDQFLYCKNTMEWFKWAGHCWQRDTMGCSLAAVEQVVEHYLAEFKRVSDELTTILAAGESAKSDVAVKLKDKRMPS